MNQQGKIGLIFGVCALGILVLSVFHLRNLIRGPFALRPAPPPVVNQTANEPSKTADTDQDGLVDWDEVNVYGTSAYVQDTDSDGIKDGEEIKSGKNPNCREGADCGALGKGEATADLESGVASSGITPVLPNTLSPAQIRVILERSGVPKTILEKISDVDLMKVWQEVNTQQGSSNLPTLQKIDPAALKLQLARMAAPELKQMLIILGLAPSQLEGMSEEKLRSLVLEKLTTPPSTP